MRSPLPGVVTPAHTALMRLVAETAHHHGLNSVHLEGGTALSAYYLGHRESEDLDFFGDPDFNARAFLDLLEPSFRTSGLGLDRIGSPNPSHARALATDPQSGFPIKLDFAASSSFRLAPREATTEGIEIASYRDLCAGKLHAVCDRFEVRDFVDLHAILSRPNDAGTPPDDAGLTRRGRSLILDLIETDPGLDATSIGTALVRGKGQPIVKRFPLRLLRPFDEAEVQRTISILLDICVGMSSATLP